MSTAAVSTSSIYQELQAYFQQRGSDLQQLGQALQSGDLAGAQQEYAAIQALGQSGPFDSGNAFQKTQRQQDFDAIGQALQSGDLAGAQQAFAQLQATFHHHRQVASQSSTSSQPAVIVNLTGASPASSSTSTDTGSQTTAPATSAASPAGSEIVLNLGTITPGEQITIGISNASDGSEQVTIGVANSQNQSQSPEQITLNLAQNSNQEIILDLFNSTASSTSQSSGVSLTA